MDIKKRVKFLEEKARLSLTEKEREKFYKDYKLFLKDLSLLDDFKSDVKGISNDDLIDKNWTLNELRSDDKVRNNNSRVLDNAIETDGDYIVYKK